MKYTVIKTKLTYEQLKERFDDSIINNSFSKREPGMPYFGGNISRDGFRMWCLLPYWRSYLNGLCGKIIEEDTYCTVVYKINLPLGLYKIGKAIIASALISPIIAFLWIRFNSGFIARAMTNSIVFLDKLIIMFPILMPFILFLGIVLLNTKKEGEECREKLEEIVSENYEQKLSKVSQKFIGEVRKVQAEVIMIDNIHNPKLLVCQAENENGLIVQYYKEKEVAEFYEKIGDYVTVEVEGDSYKIIEKVDKI